MFPNTDIFYSWDVVLLRCFQGNHGNCGSKLIIETTTAATQTLEYRINFQKTGSDLYGRFTQQWPESVNKMYINLIKSKLKKGLLKKLLGQTETGVGPGNPLTLTN